LSIPRFVSEFLQKLRKVQLPKFQQELEQRNFEYLSPYIPVDSQNYIKGLLANHTAIIKVVKGRNSKLGDFRPVPKGQIPTITLNNDLNPLSFLITFLHEWAHLLIDEQFGRSVKPHGKEWKSYYQMLMVPILEIESLPKEFKAVLHQHIKKPKASALGDPILAKYLKQFDAFNGLHLEEIKSGSLFQLKNGLVLEKGEKRRTRYLCKDPKTKKQYTVHALAEVELFEPID